MPRKGKSVKYKGKTYESIKHLADEVGIKVNTLSVRMSKGLTIKQAVEFKPARYIKFKGKGYNSKAEMLRDVAPGVNLDMLNYYLKKNDGSIPKAIKAALKSQQARLKKAS